MTFLSISFLDRRLTSPRPSLLQLLWGRTSMVSDSANSAKKALTVAIRYAAVRRQFSAGGNNVETQLLDYPIHQRRLMPLLAQAIAGGFTALEMEKCVPPQAAVAIRSRPSALTLVVPPPPPLHRMYHQLTEALEVLEPNDPNLQDVLAKLKEVHATSAGLKGASRPLDPFHLVVPACSRADPFTRAPSILHLELSADDRHVPPVLWRPRLLVVQRLPGHVQRLCRPMRESSCGSRSGDVEMLTPALTHSAPHRRGRATTRSCRSRPADR